MRVLYILSAIILLIISHRFYRISKTNVDFKVDMSALNDTLDSMKLENNKLIDLIQKEPPRKIADIATREHTIILNSNENVSEYIFPYTLKNVKHVELITGIVPKSQYRVNEYNNVVNNVPIEPGSYGDIISLLMFLNQELYDSGTGVGTVLMYDSVKRNIVAAANVSTILNLSNKNTIAPIIGFDKDTYVFPSGTVSDPDIITSSLNYFTSLKATATAGGTSINNYPPAYYTFTDQFPTNAAPSTWEYLYSPYRVNMKHQLYVDILMDEVTYWDSTHRLARIFIPEDKEEVEYQSYGRPILRSLNQNYIDLDKLTFRLKAVVSDNNTHDYDLNGINYSLQVQITTVDPYLLRH